MDRDDKITEEAMALWWALFAEPPFVVAQGQEILDAVIKAAPAKPYEPADNDPS